jgi:serine/threonine-protein kinase HipA
MNRKPRRLAKLDTLEVWLDAVAWGRLRRIGALAHDRGQIRFRYDPAWLADPVSFMVDPDLSLDSQVFFPNARAGNFGIFLDSSPDRWGQTLMDRREAMAARDTGRTARTLRAWDYLMGVQDITRQGALRFRVEGTADFLDHQRLAAPPVTSLAELESVAYELTRHRIDRLDQLRQWLAVLVAPGASLGGARPKANFSHPDDSLWIAKFPSRDDRRDMAAWETLTHRLAARAGIVVPEARLARLGGRHRTFCTRRFDRQTGSRVFFASAMTLLRKDNSMGASYIELAEWLARHGDPIHIASDLEQLFRRVAFNVCVGNRDDHLRNHGFLLTPSGWRLSPAYDVNPSPELTDHVLAIDDVDPRPNLSTVAATAGFYGLSKIRGEAIVRDIHSVVRGWRTKARSLGIPPDEILTTAPAFSAME